MNVVAVQCGGPTAVVNASLAAVVAACQALPGGGRIWGSRLGMQGLIENDWLDLTSLTAAQLGSLRRQPGAALGSSRYRMQDRHLNPLLERLQQRSVAALLLIGGNGTMAAAHRIAAAATDAGYRVGGEPLCVVGVPKTIDNDLAGTEVAPGYGSAARFIAQTARDVGLDLRAMRNYDDVSVLEVMGRHSGWLAAASALARRHPADPPHLILLPEAPLDEDRFLAAVQRIHHEQGICLIVAAEGARDAAGEFLAERYQAAERDASGQKMLSMAAGVAPYLASLVRRRLGLLCRQLRPDTIQRSSSQLASPADRDLAIAAGTTSVEWAAGGVSDVMAALKWDGTRYTVRPTPLAAIVGHERPVPPEFVRPDAFDVTPAFVEYAARVAGPLDTAAVVF